MGAVDWIHQVWFCLAMIGRDVVVMVNFGKALNVDEVLRLSHCNKNGDEQS